MMTTRFVLFFFFMGTALLGSAQENEFVLIGRIMGDDSSNTAVLTHLDTGEKQTVPIDKGQFVFKGKVKRNNIALVGTDKIRSGLGVWLTNDTLRATFKVVKYDSGMQLIQPETIIGNSESADYLATIDTLNSYSGRRLGLSKQQVRQRKQDYIYNYVRAHPSSPYSAFLLETNVKAVGVSLAKELFTYLSSDIRNSEDGESIKKVIANQDATFPGKVVDRFVLPDSNGIDRTLSTAGKPFTLLYLWASWCSPCRYHNKDLVRLHQKVDTSKLQMISISLDTDKQAWLKAISKDGLQWEQLSDLKGWDGPIAKQFATYGVPQTILVDKDYKIIATDLNEATRLITEN